MINARVKDGILVVNKPAGFTSHDVVAVVRRKLNMQKIGHAGTLDPIATGVLVVLVGKATGLFERFMRFEKEYAATLRLGARTDSGDSSGSVVEEKEFGHITRPMAETAFLSYKGRIMQIPPMYSAVKHKGKRLYQLALKGKEVERKPREVTVSDIKVLDFRLPDIDFYMRCSKGTYVRQLGEDVARDLGSVGHICRLQRTSIGPFTIEQSVGIDDIDGSKVQPFSG
ncbi:MAG: tRNA pseudouridine(55) synthase TruB [Candidatus Omnitrophica bacterium]|jgi:tRNA pseudouridine55 synthase|nr:tRNA pseudouridine(55) synthase TruB [Candidatus Omnitrophota bacterium]